jgi:hypothetical protein
VKSSRMLLPHVSAGGGPSGHRPAAVQAAMSRASLLRRIAMHAPPPGTSKKLPKHPRPQGLGHTTIACL